MLHFCYMENNFRPPQPEQRIESIGLSDIPAYLLRYEKIILATEEFIAGLTKILDSGKGTEEQKLRWQRDIRLAGIDLTQMKEEGSYVLEKPANETIKKEKGAA